MNQKQIGTLDSILPQTQCRECSYAGCKPYATAIVEAGEKIDRCLPGGVSVLKALSKETGQSAEPFLKAVEARTPELKIAVIDEALCVGCTKCIDACPTDAIIGSAKKMHAILTDECSGCGLCVEPCPMDCITLVPHQNTQSEIELKNIRRARYLAKQARNISPDVPLKKNTAASDYIAAALARKKSAIQKKTME